MRRNIWVYIDGKEVSTSFHFTYLYHTTKLITMVRRSKKATSRQEKLQRPPLMSPSSPSPVVSSNEEGEEDDYFGLLKTTEATTHLQAQADFSQISDLWNVAGNPVVDDTLSLPGEDDQTSRIGKGITINPYLIPIHTGAVDQNYPGVNYIITEASSDQVVNSTTTSTPPSLPAVPELTTDTTTNDVWLSTLGHASQPKKRPTSQSAGGEKKKRQKKQKTTDITSFGYIPLTAPVWPSKVGVPCPLPTRLFFSPQDPNVEIEVYAEPQHPGVSLRHYPNAPYEKRINLGVNLFNKLQAASDTILSHVDRIQKEAEGGLLSSDSHVESLDVVGSTQVLVNLYRGRAKVHIGTSSYVEEMKSAPKFINRKPKSTTHCGSTISVHAMREINQRVGRVLKDYTWSEDTTAIFIP